MLSKKISIPIVLILATFLLAGFAFARDLEVPLPQTGGGSAITQTPLLPDYIKYVFNFSIGIAGLISFLMMVYGGFRYLTSAGNPSAMSDANSQIFASIIGLAILLGSYLLLTTINPQLVVINPQLTSSGLTTTTTPGVYLCKEQTGNPATNCDGPYNADKNSITPSFYNRVNYVRFENTGGTEYGVVLHEDQYLRGECEFLLSSGASSVMPMQKLGNRASSISVFKQDPNISGGNVTLCENRECKKTNPNDTQEAKRFFTFEEGSNTSKPSVLSGFPNLQNFNYSNGDQIDGASPGLAFWNAHRQGVSAFELKSYMAILYRDNDYNGICDIFNVSDPALGSGGDIIGNDQASSMMILKARK